MIPKSGYRFSEKIMRRADLRALVSACPCLRGYMTFCSGNPVVDHYIAEGYETVRGMSSRFSATICAHVIRRQTELGISGHFAEVGTFEGRFFIAMEKRPSNVPTSAKWPDMP